ncbi:MAG: MurR/RpiR family transcriptional regulator [Faecalibacillus sp.]
MFNLIIILLSLMNSEVHDSNNYKIAKYILENLTELEDCTITELAKKCYVSNSSISRFCRDIGLKDYNGLKNQIAKYQISHQTAIHKFHYKGIDSDQSIPAYIDEIINNLELLKNSISQKDILALVEDIDKYKHVAAFGYLQSENVALNLQYDLQTNRKIIYTCMQYTNQIEHIKNADENHLIIIFSESGTYFKRAFARTPIFKNTIHKPKIYLITSNQDINLPYVDKYIRYQSKNDYASHPYPLSAISGIICSQYSKYITKKNIKES